MQTVVLFAVPDGESPVISLGELKEVIRRAEEGGMHDQCVVTTSWNAAYTREEVVIRRVLTDTEFVDLIAEARYVADRHEDPATIHVSEGVATRLVRHTRTVRVEGPDMPVDIDTLYGHPCVVHREWAGERIEVTTRSVIS